MTVDIYTVWISTVGYSSNQMTMNNRYCQREFVRQTYIKRAIGWLCIYEPPSVRSAYCTAKERLPVSDKPTAHQNKVDERAKSMQPYLDLLDNIIGELEALWRFSLWQRGSCECHAPRLDNMHGSNVLETTSGMGTNWPYIRTESRQVLQENTSSNTRHNTLMLKWLQNRLLLKTCQLSSVIQFLETHLDATSHVNAAHQIKLI